MNLAGVLGIVCDANISESSLRKMQLECLAAPCGSKNPVRRRSVVALSGGHR